MNDSLQAEGTPLSEDERIAANRTAIFQALRDNGVLRAVASYAGSGDSGGPDGVSFEKSNGSRFDDIPTVLQHRKSRHWADGKWHNTMLLEDKPLDDTITDIAMDIVEQHFGGWENGDGASGDVIFSAADGSVVIEHNAYYTESDYSEVRL